MKNVKIKLNGQFIYLCAFFLYYSMAFLWTTMFRAIIPETFLTFVRYIALILLLTKIILFDSYQYNKALIILVCGIIAVATAFSSGYASFVLIILFVVASQDVSFDKVLKVSLACGCTIAVIAYLASQVGIIEELIYQRGGRLRHAFGSIYPTDFAAHIFYFLLTYFYLKRGRWSVLNICVCIVTVLLMDIFCDTRLDEGMIIILIIVALFYNGILSKKWAFIRNLVLTWSVPLCAVGTIALCVIYNSNVEWMSRLNSLLSNRLYYGRRDLLTYLTTPFGSYIEQHGRGGTTVSLASRGLSYSYIDLSYIRIMFMYGYVVLIIICIAYVGLCTVRLKKGDILLPLCIFLVAISSMVDQHMIDFSYNVFFLCFFMKLYTPGDMPDDTRQIKFRIGMAINT